MQIKVMEDADVPTDLTGGEYAISCVDIFVNKDLSERTKRELIVHAVIENYCPSWGHDKVEELTGLIQDGFDQLGL